MENKLNILFLGGAKRVSIGELFIKKAKEKNIDLKLFSYELDKQLPIASIANIIIGKKWTDKEIFDHLRSIVDEYAINIILPFVDPSILIAARLKEMLPNVFIPVSSPDLCEIMFDKIKSNEWFINNGFPVPPQTSDLPLIAKPRFGSASNGLIFIKKPNEFNFFKENYTEASYLVQQFIDGYEYTVDCYVSCERKNLAIVPRKRLEVTSGESTKSVTVKDKEIILIAEKILNSDNFSGPITIQFIKEKNTGKLYIMEINPRLGGGVLTSIKAGADMIEFIINEFLNLPVIPVINWEENVIMTRTFREFYFYADNN